MVIAKAPKKSPVAAMLKKARKTRVSKAAVAHVKKVASAIRQTRGSNLSRKQIMTLQRDKHHDKLIKKVEKESALKESAVRSVAKANNKQTRRPFDHSELRVVHEGLTAAIEALGEQVTPTSLLMCTLTTLGRSQDRKQAPYLLVICAACLPKVSKALVARLFPQLLRLCEQCLAESDHNALLLAKSMKLVDSIFTSLDRTTAAFQALKKLEPSRLNVPVMCMYVTTLRKILQRAALTGDDAFFLENLPEFVSLCVGNFVDAPHEVMSTSCSQLQTLLSKTLGPSLLEKPRCHGILNHIISDKLTQLFKPHLQSAWMLAADLVTTMYERINYLKRTPQASQFMQWYPASTFLLKVLNKLRYVDDSQLNAHIERAMVAIGCGMSVEQFVQILPFNPQDVEKVRITGGSEDDVWKNSYLVNVVRRIASHDSLPFFVQHFFPIIHYCQKQYDECIAGDRENESLQWMALLTQYWRVAVGFCHYPQIITTESFRDLAKALVGLLSTSLIDTAANALHTLCHGYYSLAKLEQDEDEDENDENDNGDGDAEFAPGSKGTKQQLEHDDVFLRFHDAGWNPHAFHNISQAQAQQVCQTVIAKFSANIMPKLCNVYKTHDSTAVLNAIQSFSLVCSANVMQTILKGILEVGADIAAAESGGLQQLTTHRRVVLDIACAIISQLDLNSLTSIYETIVEPVLSDPAAINRLLQKKAYKLLFVMFEHRVKDIYPLFPRIMSLLAVGQQHVTISGLKMRIRCVNWALDACKMYYPDTLVAAIKAAVGEVVLFARERNSGARDMAMEVIEKMHRYLVGTGAPPNALLHLVLAGLSGKTGLMVSCTIVCLAKLVYIAFDRLSHQDLCGTTSMCFQLMEATVPEIRTAAATYARMVLKLMKRSTEVANAVMESLPKLLMAIALVTSQSGVSSSVRMMMRVLLEKCIKRFGYDTVDKLFPMGSKRFLQYTNKLLRRDEKKEEREQKKRLEAKKNEFDDLFLGTMKADGAADDGDLLEGGGLSQFVAHRSALGFAGGAADDDDDGEDDMCLVSEDNKLRIMSKADKKREDDAKRRKALADRLLRRTGVVDPRRLATDPEDANTARRKRGRTDEDDAADDLVNDELVLRYGGSHDEQAAAKATAAYNRGRTEGATSASQRNAGAPSSVTMKLRDQKQAKKEMNKTRVLEDIRLGDEYRGKGSGDVKRGSTDPFAYVPLNRRFMNKRHRRQAVQRFEAVGTTALKGNKAARRS
mmetsp:Transcript_32710/g.37886  ORF Transcript_32710/g.37886 Transcript_32710/m.37886 type:complete len:1233 (-) Transcript_32710:131-3829(-)|eukprot:CAMPEP_0176415444 /NCGR_PEP_ID=MMETSP0127-20121128/5812_1 /TAXON_ID=938130 /ORGANISM="Platyophrya macrostoma, Strain WH" /LENGTH=1232 /DNA_ID=CAMNT_0017795445 /DNA_START=16 /DNA_END=3714 /DNA_ORIENTATION=-